MAVKKILRLGDPVLRMVCEQVDEPQSPEIGDLVRDLADTLAHARETTGYGRGIAAVQIGVKKRVLYFNGPGLPGLAMVNPKISRRSTDTIVVWDACLSFLSIFMQVKRHRDITVEYQDLKGNSHVLEGGPEHNLSELLQHEIDHLDGILAVDRIVDTHSIVSREEFELRYCKGSPYES